MGDYSKTLSEILQKTALRLVKEKQKNAIEDLKAAARKARVPHSLSRCFENKPLIIAEIKFASPTLGQISDGFDPVGVAEGYLTAGAGALSILTEPSYFKGHHSYLTQVREALPEAFLLRKDFIIDEYQIYESRVLGADAILLIAGILSNSELDKFYKIAESIGLSVLMEVHTSEELKLAQDLGCKLIGVNNRNLKTMEVSISTSEKLAPMKKNHFLVSESGLSTSQHVKYLGALGFDGFLIGSHFMKSENPGKSLQELLAGVV